MKNLPLLFLLVAPFFAMAQQPGVVTEHGFRYVNHTNRGGQKPKPGETVKVHFEAIIGDSVMSSTWKSFASPREYALPTADKLPKRVPAIYDGLLLSGVGDSVTLYEKIDSFLQKFIPEGLKSEKEIRYNLLLLSIISQEELQKRAAEEEKQAAEEARIGEEAKKRAPEVALMAQTTAADYKAGNLQSKLATTASGLKMLVMEQGNGAAVKRGEAVRVHYYGFFTDGMMFDNSFERGQSLPFEAGVGQMIQGFDEGVMLLKHGGKAYFFLPPQLAYGEQGQGMIPPNSELIFYVELL